MKKIYIHGGYQRCATTFLQQNIFSQLKDFKCLSKPREFFSGIKKINYHDKNLNYLDRQIEKLYSLQELAFTRRYEVKSTTLRNNSLYIKKYKELLLNILTTSHYNKFILSDETLFDRINYFGHENILDWKNIVEYLKNKLEIEVKIILTVRKQPNIIGSVYAIDYYRQEKKFSNFNIFVDNFTNEKNKDSEIFNFNHRYRSLKDLFKCEIIVLPIEELEQDKNSYKNRLSKFLNTNFDESLNWDSKIKSLHTDNKKNNFLVYVNKYQSIYDFLSKVHQFLLLNKFYKNNLIKYSKSINVFIRKFMKGSTKKGFRVSEENTKKIKLFYASSNKELEKSTGLNLGDFNYY